jgi:hypothetical protein
MLTVRRHGRSFYCRVCLEEGRHMESGVSRLIAPGMPDRTSQTGLAALLAAGDPGLDMNMRRTSVNIIASCRKGPDRASHQAGPVSAGITR